MPWWVGKVGWTSWQYWGKVFAWEVTGLDCTHQGRDERFVEIRAKRPPLGTRTRGHGQSFTRRGCQSQSFDVFYTMQPLPHRIHCKSFPRRPFETELEEISSWFLECWRIYWYQAGRTSKSYVSQSYWGVLLTGNAQDSFGILHHRWWISGYTVWRWRWLFRRSWFHCCSTLPALCRQFLSWILSPSILETSSSWWQNGNLQPVCAT